MEKEFKAAEDPEVIDEMQNQNVGLVVKPTFELGAPGDTQEFSGNISPPYLAITHGVGKLAESGNFKPGDLVLGGENLIAHQGEKIKLVIVSSREYWKEYIDSPAWTAGKRPRVFPTKQQAKEAGLSTEYDPVTREMPQAPVCMLWSLLIEKPDNLVCQAFCIEANGKRYAPALFAVERSAYTSVRDAFGMAVRFTTKGRGLFTAVWEMNTFLSIRKTGNKAWVPKINMVGSLTGEEVVGLTKATTG